MPHRWMCLASTDNQSVHCLHPESRILALWCWNSALSEIKLHLLLLQVPRQKLTPKASFSIKWEIPLGYAVSYRHPASIATKIIIMNKLFQYILSKLATLQTSDCAIVADMLFGCNCQSTIEFRNISYKRIRFGHFCIYWRRQVRYRLWQWNLARR